MRGERGTRVNRGGERAGRLRACGPELEIVRPRHQRPKHLGARCLLREAVSRRLAGHALTAAMARGDTSANARGS